MRFKIEIELKNEHFPIDYRPTIISLFKNSLTFYNGGEYFNTYYEKGKDKPFTFSVFIANSKFTKEMILVENKKLDIVFSTNDIGTGIVFFNALLLQKNKAYPLSYGNSMIIKNILLEKEFTITKNIINVIFRSPLCVRDHNKELNKDIYYSCEKENFNEVLNKVIGSQVDRSNLSGSILDGFSIEPIEYKKTVVKHHSQHIEATLGVFQLKGNLALLNYLYTNGIGSRKSSGFGFMDIIGEE